MGFRHRVLMQGWKYRTGKLDQKHDMPSSVAALTTPAKTTANPRLTSASLGLALPKYESTTVPVAIARLDCRRVGLVVTLWLIGGETTVYNGMPHFSSKRPSNLGRSDTARLALSRDEGA